MPTSTLFMYVNARESAIVYVYENCCFVLVRPKARKRAPCASEKVNNQNNRFWLVSAENFGSRVTDDAQRNLKYSTSLADRVNMRIASTNIFSLDSIDRPRCCSASRTIAKLTCGLWVSRFFFYSNKKVVQISLTSSDRTSSSELSAQSCSRLTKFTIGTHTRALSCGRVTRDDERNAHAIFRLRSGRNAHGRAAFSWSF